MEHRSVDVIYSNIVPTGKYVDGACFPVFTFVNYDTTYLPVTPKASKPFVPVTRKGKVPVKITLTGTTVSTEAIRGGYIVAKYSLASVTNEELVIAMGQRWNYDRLIPCVSWQLIGATTRERYRLNTTQGILPYAMYNGQLITAATGFIELWAPGDYTATITVATQTFNLGVYTNDTALLTTYTIAPCVVSVTGNTGFAAYMTSCV